MLGGLEQQVAQTSSYTVEIVVAIIGLAGTLGAAFLVSRRKK